MEEAGALPSIVAKTVILANAVTDSWAAVGDYVGSPDRVNILAVTPLECGREMYSDAEWIMMAAFHWVLPLFVDLVAGLVLTTV